MFFTLDELTSYLQVDSINNATGQLLLSLTEPLVLDVVGAEQMLDPRVKPIALEVAARAYRNANGFASEAVDDYKYQRAPGTQAAGVYLTDDERATLLAVKSGTVSRTVRSVQMRSSSGPWRYGEVEWR